MAIHNTDKNNHKMQSQLWDTFVGRYAFVSELIVFSNLFLLAGYVAFLFPSGFPNFANSKTFIYNANQRAS